MRRDEQLRTNKQALTGLLIAFEGLGGSGKSTIAQKTVEWLDRSKMPVVMACEPGGTTLGQGLRKLLLSTDHPMTPLAEAFLFEADRTQSYADIILPNILNGRIVISDRNVYGTIAYQGFGRGVDLNLIDTMNAAATFGCWPDLIFVLDVDPYLALQRRGGRDAIDKFDDETLAFQKRVREGYLFAASRDSGRAYVIDAGRSIDQVFEDIRQSVAECINARFPGCL